MVSTLSGRDPGSFNEGKCIIRMRAVKVTVQYIIVYQTKYLAVLCVLANRASPTNRLNNKKERLEITKEIFNRKTRKVSKFYNAISYMNRR